MNAPRWDGERWRIRFMKEGKTFSFSSKTPGPKGRREVMAKFEQWYYSEGTGEKTVGKVASEFLEDVAARRGASSEAYIQYERYIRLYIAPHCGARKICKMALRDWQSVINEATGQKKPLSEKTLKSLRGVIMGIIKFGYQDYQCELPRGNLYIPKGHSKKEKEFLERDQVKRLLEPSELWYHSLFSFLLVTGLRPSEGLGIKIGDIKGNRLYIRRGVTASGKISDGKTANARRLVPLGRTAKAILEETIRRNEEMNLDTDWIFCSPDGSMGNQSTMRNHWAKLKEERDLCGTVYSLRHTFVTLMKNTLPEQTLRDIIGHGAGMSTFETYGHITESESVESATIIDLTFTNLEKDRSQSD